jgi:hypothetical protein
LQSQPRLSVGEAIIDAGLARYEPTGLKGSCRGLCRSGGRSPVIVEGQVVGLSVRKPRITLYFGPRKGSDFSVTILPRDNKAFERAHTRLAGLAGQNIRVRGLLDTRFRPQIEISDLDAVEVIGQEQHAAASRALK